LKGGGFGTPEDSNSLLVTKKIGMKKIQMKQIQTLAYTQAKQKINELGEEVEKEGGGGGGG